MLFSQRRTEHGLRLSKLRFCAKKDDVSLNDTYKTSRINAMKRAGSIEKCNRKERIYKDIQISFIRAFRK